MKSVAHPVNLARVYSRSPSPALLLSTPGFLDGTGDENSQPRLEAGHGAQGRDEDAPHGSVPIGSRNESISRRAPACRGAAQIAKGCGPCLI